MAIAASQVSKDRKSVCETLDLLLDAVRHANRAYFFDNSRQGGELLWVAEITDGRDLEIESDPMPIWFRNAVWDKIQS